MNCKYCGQLLDEGNSLCPHCGKDNAEAVLAEEIVAAEEVVTEIPAEEVSAEETVVAETPVEETATEEETQTTEIKPGFRMTPGKLTLTIVAAVALVAVLVALVLGGMGAKLSFTGGEEDVVPAETSEVTMETAPPATIPADGNPDDVTCKGTYTVSDEEIVNLKDVVIATAGEHEMRNADLQIFYWMQVQQFLSEYSYYASYLGLDYNQPLDTQLCPMGETFVTWQQYFLDSAIKTWHNYQALNSESQENGFQLSEEIQAEIDSAEQILTSNAELSGFESLEDFLAYNVGHGCTFADYKAYLNLYYRGYAYFEELYNQYDPTQEELEAFFDSHAADYEAGGITKDAKLVDVRHILIMPEGADSSTIRTETFPEEAWAASEKKAQEILESWKAGEATEESFGLLANAHSQDGDGTTGGLYTQVTQGQMVAAFDAWCFDESRLYGDVDIVKTEFGYHIMFFVNSQPQWVQYAESDYINEKVNAQIVAATEKYPLTVDYSKIALGLVTLG